VKKHTACGKQSRGPSLFQVGPDRVFHFRFQIAGRRIQRSTGTADLTRAREIAEKAFRRAKKKGAK